MEVSINNKLFNLDWDIDLTLASDNVNCGINLELVTSHSATPGCGNTGSFNSFCC